MSGVRPRLDRTTNDSDHVHLCRAGAKLERSTRSMRRLLFGTLGVLASMAALVSAGVLLLLPSLMERIVEAQLGALHLGEVDLDVVGVASRRMQIRNVHVGENLSIDAVDVEFDGGLLTGRIARMRVAGATWHVHAGLEGIDLAPFGQLRGEGNGTGSTFPYVDVRASTIVLHGAGRRVQLPVEGMIEPVGRRLRIDGSVAVLKRSLDLRVLIETGAAAADVRFDLHDPGGSKISSDRSAKNARSGLSLRGRYRRAGGERTLAATFSLAEARRGETILRRRWTVEGARAAGRVSLDLSRGVVEHTDIRAEIDRLVTDGAAFESIELRATDVEEAIAWRLGVSTPKNVVSYVRGLIPREIKDWIGPRARTVDVSIELDPNVFLPAIVRAAELGRITLSGRGRLGLHPPRLHLPAASVRMAPGAVVVGDLATEDAQGRGSVELTVDRDGAVVSLLHGTLEARAVRLQGAPTSLEQIRAEVAPASRRLITARTADVPIEVGRIAARVTAHVTLGGLRFGRAATAYVQTEGRDLAIRAVWPLSGSAAVTGSGDLDVVTGSGHLGASLSSVALSRIPRLTRIVSRALDARVSGNVALQADLDVDRGRVAPNIRIALSNGRLEPYRSIGQKSIRGLSGTVTFDRLAPLGTPGGQHIRWSRIDLGGVSFGEGFIDLRVDELRSILVEKAEVRGPRGGTLHVGAFRIKPEQRELALDLFCQRLSLGRWLEVLAGGKVTGEGQLYGHVPVRVDLTDPKLSFGRGYLMAAPGGTLRVKDLEAAGSLLAQISPFGRDGRFQLHRLIKARLLEALQALELKELELRLVPKNEVLDLEVHLSGKGLHGARQEIGGLTLNFHNFGAGLNEILRFGREATELGARTKTEMKNDPVLEMFD